MEGFPIAGDIPEPVGDVIVSWHPHAGSDRWWDADILYRHGHLAWRSKGTGRLFTWKQVVDDAVATGVTLMVWRLEP